MKNLEFIAEIYQGYIVPPAYLHDFMKAHESKQVRIILTENLKKRSLPQNSFYWSVIIPHVRQFRMDNGDTVSIEQVHEDLIAEFSPLNERKNLDGRMHFSSTRTHEMNKKEFSDYVTAIMARLSEFGCHIPLEGEAS